MQMDVGLQVGDNIQVGISIKMVVGNQVGVIIQVDVRVKVCHMQVCVSIHVVTCTWMCA